jgi:hypothetical protein
MQAARVCQQAVSELAALARARADIESATQRVVAASVEYRLVLEKWAAQPGRREDQALQAARASLGSLPAVLECAAIAYNCAARTDHNLALSRQAIESSRSNSWRTVS